MHNVKHDVQTERGEVRGKEEVKKALLIALLILSVVIVSLTVLVSAAFAACSSQPEKAVTDRQQLIRVALEWALVDKNLPHYAFLPDPTNVLISLDGLSADELPTLPGVTLTALTEEELQKKADAEGSLGSPRTCRPRDCGLLRVSLGNLVIAGDTAEIWVSNERVESSTEAATPFGPSNPAVLIGGFCELQLRKTGGQWAIVDSICALA